jgi:hypothetical protein
MPLQNRINPWGEILASPARGTFMGNRGGVIHNEERQIVRQYASRRWISCLLEFKDRHRAVMSPNRYTELFFTDEAVALAAGHRPCAECRRERFNAFKQAWLKSGNPRETNFLYADEMDVVLHRTRIESGKDSGKGKVMYQAPLRSLPDGTFVHIDDAAWLVKRGMLFLWTPEGYSHPRRISDDRTVTVLTPAPIVQCLRHGYQPEIHRSALPG